MIRRRRLRALAASSLACVACVVEPRDRPARITPWPAARDTIATRLFPEFADARRGWPEPRAMPRADAPRCPTPPTAAGRELRTHAGTIYLPGSVSLRLPPGFVESSLGAIANDPSRGLIAHWIDTTAGSVAGAVVSLTGAPTGGFGAFGSDRAARQLSLAECRSDVPHAGTAVVEFAVAEPGRGTLHLLQAVWPLASDRWLVWTASTRREADLPGLRAALASVRVAE